MRAIAAVFICVVGGVCRSATYHVDPRIGDDAHAGTESEPFATIVAALAKEDAGEVVLAAGSHVLANTLSLAKAVTVRGATGNPADVRVSGATGQRAFVLDHSSAVLRDIVIENCTLTKINQDGVGVCVNSGTISNCVVRNCRMTAMTGRGTVRLNSDTAYAYNCVISNNFLNGGNSGGGKSYGAGLGITKGTAVNCIVADNSVSAANEVLGAGVYVESGTLANCTVVRNRGNACGGVYTGNTSAKVVNCLIWGNTADGAGGDAQTDVWAGKSSCFDHCIARVAINGSCLAASDWPIADGAFTPFATSLAHDAAVATSGFVMPPFDVCGNPRLADAGIDIGAVEGSGVVPLVAMTLSDRMLLGLGAVTFTAWTENLDGITGYTWNFGDGTVDSDSGASASHAYSDFGEFSVGLTVHTAAGDVACKVGNTVSVLPRKIYVVKGNAGAAYPYASEKTAAPDVSSALATACAGQEIVIAPETYPIAANMNIASAVALRGLTGNPADVVLKAEHTSQFIRIAADGAGLYDLTVDGNGKSVGADGILLRLEGQGVASNCVFRNASGGAYASHGAVYLSGTDALLTHCVVSNNVTSGSGYKNSYAGVKLESAARASNCLIIDNRHTTKQDGCVAGVYVKSGTLDNCTVVGNSGKKCGGVRCDAGSVVNCAIAGNSSDDNGDDYANVYPGKDTLFSRCATDIKAIAGGTDCRFVADRNAIFANYGARDFTPASGSILRENGAEVEHMPALDLAGNPRVIGERIDIGAYEADLSRLEVKLNASVSQAFAPARVVFTAEVGGAGGAGCTYAWTFGDGTETETSEPTAAHDYAAAGDYTVRVTLTKGSESVSDGVALHFVPPVLRVKGGNENAAFPYDTLENAASNLNQALAVAIPRNIIEVEPGVVRERDAVRVTLPVTLRGRTGNPADVVVNGAGATGSLTEVWYFDLADPGCRFEGLTLRSESSHRLVRIDVAGGMLTNCVVTGPSYEAAIMNVSDFGLVTHCIVSNSYLECNSGGSSGFKGVYVCTKHGGRLSNSLITKCSAVASPDSMGRASAIIHTLGRVDNCTVVDNDLRGVGDAVLRYQSRFDGKTTTLLTTSDDVVRDSIFAANTAKGEPALTIMLKGATAYRCVGDFEAEGITTVASAEELFRRPAKGDWRLRGNSPARDLASKAVLPGDLSETDLRGNPRVCGYGLDAGCYECIGGGLLIFVK